MDVLMIVLNLIQSLDVLVGDDHDVWFVVLILLSGVDVIRSPCVIA